MSGFVLLHRKLIGNPQFRGKDDEYAAIWLIAKAAWRETVVPVGRHRVTVQRGECAFAVSYLAEAWGCSKSTAHNTLRHLEKTGFLTTKPERGCTRIFLMNYDTYQRPEDDPRTHPERKPERKRDANPNAIQEQTRTQDDQNNDENTEAYGDLLDYPERKNGSTPNASPNANGTLARTKKEKEDTKKEDKEDSTPHSPPRGQATDDAFETFWTAYPRREGANPKKPARQKFDRAIANGTDPGTIIEGARQYAAQCRANGNLGTKYTATAVVWLNQERWKDEHRTHSNRNAGNDGLDGDKAEILRVSGFVEPGSSDIAGWPD
ncbi:hypothetical protein [Hwanghaeella sp.]|uniref:hypothetical protein n=1 Tax=Hwanghaeella sp. TaxID=2605943 RepID=UPI003CCC218C